MAELIDRQRLLEEEMITLGVKRYREENSKAKEGNHESTTPPGIELIRNSVAKVAQALEDLISDHEKGVPSKIPKVAIRQLQELPVDTSSFLALKGTINYLSSPIRLIKVAELVGNFLEDEARFRFFKRENPALFGVVSRDLAKKTTNYRKQKNVLVHASNKADLEWTNWTKDSKVRMGILMVELICTHTKLFTIDLVYSGKGRFKNAYTLLATEEATKWVDKKNSICELLSPIRMPCIASPVKWSSIYEGGYHQYNGVQLVKTADLAYKKELETKDLSKVFDAVNTVQETAWKINTNIFKVMDSLYSSQASVSVVPEFLERTMSIQYPREGTLDEKIAWKREATFIHSENAKRKTKRVQFSQLMWMARKFEQEARFYFPHTIDFRGRLYASTAFLNPQGEDSAKGLLTFADRKPLGDSGLSWLAVHGANTFGNDKVSLEDRYQWSHDNLKEIVRTATDPLEYTWWMEADKPWQFLAFCFEFTEAMNSKNPTKFRSSLPVTVDGSCNGLQHFAGMLRDEEGGKSVNLTYSEVPSDIYGLVRTEVVRRLQMDDKESLSYLWDYGKDVNRAMVKRPVMTTPYGVSMYGIRQQVKEELEKQLDKGVIFKELTAKGDLWPATKYLATHIYESIGATVDSARQGMKWLQDTCKVLSSEGKHITWTLPTGFFVKQKYVKSNIKLINTVLNGRTINLFSNNFLENTLNKQRQTNGIAPNFVHSYDACHLMLTVIEAKRQHGIESFSVVHDSFGTHASDMEVLAGVLRSTFRDIYSEDVLENFRGEIQTLTDKELPETPEYGELKIEEVLESEFFFS